MKKRIIPLLLILALCLAGCGSGGAVGAENARMRVVTTTYPIYLFTSALTRDVDGVVVERLDTGSTSCLHDYTLSVNDMKKLADADVIALNGAGLEDFMDDALATSNAAVIDCDQGVDLLPALNSHDVEEDHAHDAHDHDHEDHDHGDIDPHYWMDPRRAVQMMENLADGLSQADPAHAQDYARAAQSCTAQLSGWAEELNDLFDSARRQEVDFSGLITFHDGFQYFAAAYDLPLLASIEEEAGSEASAKEIVEITDLVKEKGIPVIFTEVNGSDATAQAIRRETGCAVEQLTMIMDGPDDQLENYYDALLANAKAVIDGFAGEELVK